MPRYDDYVPAGVIPATLLAFDDDFGIDEQATRDHLRDVAGIDGMDCFNSAYKAKPDICGIF